MVHFAGSLEILINTVLITEWKNDVIKEEEFLEMCLVKIKAAYFVIPHVNTL